MKQRQITTPEWLIEETAKCAKSVKRIGNKRLLNVYGNNLLWGTGVQVFFAKEILRRMERR